MNIKLVLQSEQIANFALPLFDGEQLPAHIAKQLPAQDTKLLKAFLQKGKNHSHNTAISLFLPSGNTVLVMGKGEKKKWNQRSARVLVRAIVQALKTYGIKEATIDAELIGAKKAGEELVEMISAELILADFTFNDYKTPPKDGWPTINKIYVAVDASPAHIKKLGSAIKRGLIIGEEANHTRRLSNTPGGDMTPALLAREAQKMGRLAGVRVRVLNEAQIKRLKMGGVLGVSRGSRERPTFIIMEHKPSSYKGKPLVLVGKGVTFDTGGLNIKPGNAMYEMHMDMSGGAAVIHGVAAIARLKIPMHVIGLVPAVENMPSGSSYHPGDVLRTITGKTIEVLNTDAEGRVILADALGYAERLKPRLVVDIATLTGAAIAALGDRVSALFTDDKEHEQLFRELGEASGDYLWPLPMWDEYFEDVKGTFGDVANVGKPGKAGATAGAIFLKQFVSYPWVHIDMAPTMTTNEQDKLAKGAKGTGPRLFVELARHLAKNSRA